jgi:hypothetical protein
VGKTLVLASVLCWTAAIAAAEIQQPPAPSPQAEETHFKPVATDWLIEPVLEFPFYSFYLGAPAVKGVAYLPNFAPRLGPRVVYKDIGTIVTFSLPIPASERERRGDSKASSLIVNSYWRQNAFDLYYQRYRGFYISSPWTELSVHKPARFAQIPDAQVLNYGLNWYYVFSPGRYSLAAAYDQSEFQIKSGGSWMIHPFYNHLDMYLGSGFVAGSDPEAFPSLPNLAAGRFDTAGAGVGYGYLYVDGHFFTGIQGAYGPGVQIQRIERSDGDRSTVYSLAAKLNVNASAGWNYDQYVGGAKLLVDSVWARVQNTQVTSTLVSLQLFFGKRF